MKHLFTKRCLFGLTYLFTAGIITNANANHSEFNDCVPTESTEDISVCSSYDWRDGQTYSESNSTATFVDFSENECGHTYTLNLTINQPGATHTVINTNDDGIGSLRYAIDNACDGDTIRFDESTSGEPIVLETGELEITNDITIIGNSRSETVISANHNSQVFTIDYESVTRISNLKITNGFSDYFGAGIENNGELFLTEVDIQECLVDATTSHKGPSGGGAAIYNDGFCRLIQCRIRENVAGSNYTLTGGPITNSGELEILNTQITGNLLYGNEYTPGGGIFNEGSLVIHNSTFSGNLAFAPSDKGDKGGMAELEGTAIVSTNEDILIYNSIIWGNGTSEAQEVAVYSDGVISTEDLFPNTLIKGMETDNFEGTETPMFVEPIDELLEPTSAGDFNLTCASPLIDEGKNQYYPDAYFIDLAGNDRFQNGDGTPQVTIDLGAYEFAEIEPTVENQVACETFIWDNGTEYTESTNDAYIVLTNTAGCDSTLQLNLTINPATQETDVQQSCGSYTWIDGITYTTETNDVIFLTENEAGCAHTMTLDLSFTNIEAEIIEDNGALTASQSGLQYQWLDCENNMAYIPGAIYESFIPELKGNYALMVTYGNCTETSDCTEYYITGIEDNGIFNEVSLFPNPTAGIVHIALGSLRNVDVKLTDITGKEIKSFNSGFDSKISFNINEAQGVYFIELSIGGDSQHFKVIKQ